MRLAAVPQHGLQQRAGAAIVQPGRRRVDQPGQADPPQRRRAPFAPVGLLLGHAVGQPVSHVVQQHVGVRPDQLEAVLGLRRVAPRHILGHVAGHAVGLVEQLLARQHALVVGVAPLRHGKVGRIGGHEIHQVPRHLVLAQMGLRAMRHLEALGLRRRAIAEMAGKQRRGQAHVVGERGRALLLDGRLAGLPVETAQHLLAGAHVAHPVRLAADAIAMIGSRVGQDIGFVDGLQQAQPYHGRRQARRQVQIRAQRPVTRILDPVGGFHQGGGLAAIERHAHRLVFDLQAAFGRQARHREVLQLRSVGGIGQARHLALGQQAPLGLAGWLHRKPQQQRHGVAALERIGVEARHRAAPILHMASLTGARVEQRPQAVGGLRGRRRRHPQLAEQSVADLEALAALERHVGRGVRKDIGVEQLLDRRGAGLHGLERLGRRKIGGGRRDGLHSRQVLGRQIGAAWRSGADAMRQRRQYND
ncbi:Uncharacterised protein [Bordetella pertussis]|nr:Uncharacterised protein [Bordetella pertussis]